MAAGTVGYTDTRGGDRDYLGGIARSIGNRIKQASNMAREERAFAAKKAEEQGTSLEEAGIGKGYFFKRALGSRFGGDRIAKTRGRFESDPPAGRDPTKNYKQRFRGGFDYKVTNQINELTSSAIVPMSGALAVGMRGVETSVRGVSSALVQISNSMNSLATAQQDLAKQAMMNGAFMRAFMTYMQRQQSRANASAEERSLESGRRRLGGSSGPIGLLPGSGGAGGAGPTGGAARAADTIQTMAKIGSNAKGGTAALKAGVSGTKGAARALSKAGVAAPNKFLQASAKNSDAILKQGAQLAGFTPSNAIAKSADDVAKLSGTKGTQAAAKLLKSDSGTNALLKMIGAAETGPTRLVSDNAANGIKMLTNAKAGSIAAQDATKMFAGMTDPRFADFNPFAKTNAGPIFFDEEEAFDVLTDMGAEKKFDDVAKLPFDKALKGTFAHEMMRAPAVKKAATTGAKKGLGKVLLKKIPLIAGLAGIAFGIQRALEGDFLGAGLEITSGLLGATGVGSGLSLGIDGFLLARDMGMMPMAKGGLLTGKRPVNALMGEAGPEIVTPLNDETFLKFGQGFIDAQKANKSQYAKLQAAGLSEYYEKQGGWESFGEAFKGIFEDLKGIIAGAIQNLNPLNWRPFGGNNGGNNGGGRVRPGATAGSDTLDIGAGGGKMNLTDEQYKWLAYAISGEAGPGDDQYAVAASILNRVAEGRGTVEQVVKADGQYEAYHKGMMKMSPAIEARLKSAEGQARLVAALERLQGRTDFKGQTELRNRVAAEDPMVDKKGNFFHYSWQTGPNSVMPSNYQMPNYQQFIQRGNTGEKKVSGLNPTPKDLQWWMQQTSDTSSLGPQASPLLGPNALNSQSMFATGAMTMTPIVNNITNNYGAGQQTSSGDSNSVGSPFDATGLSAFYQNYSLATK